MASDTSDPSRARTASEAVAEAIRSRIASGDLRPGDMLPSERVLLETYDVARPTMRGALRILESDGLVSIERGTRGGARIVEPDIGPLARRVGLLLQIRGTSMSELFEVQEVIQPKAAALAAEAHDADDIIRLRAAIEACVAADTVGDLLRHVQAFGNAVLAATHNQVLTLYGELIASLLVQSLGTYMTDTGLTLSNSQEVLDRATGGFTLLVDLIEAGEPAAAERFWRDELGRAARGPWPEPSPVAVYPQSG